MDKDDERFDGMLMTMTQQVRGVDNLMNVFFGFLRRKSDFFSVDDEKVFEHVKAAVDQQLAVYKTEKAAEERRRAEAKARKEAKAEEAKRRAEEAAKLKAKPADDDEDIVDLDISSGATAEAPEAATPKAEPVGEENEADLANKDVEENDNDKAEAEEDDDDDDDSPPPPGNGGSTDAYVWTQQLSDLMVMVEVPLGTRGRDLDVVIQARKLRVGLRGQPPLIDGDLHKKIIVDDSFWTLETEADKKHVSIALQKDNKMEWWKCVIKGDPEINTRKVQPENSKLSDLDGETRQTVEKMMFDQRQKAMGKPTSDDMKKQEMMQKFMEAHPEMDFSQAKFS